MKNTTEIKLRYYLILFALSIFFIALASAKSLCTSLIDILAQGMFPAVLFALLNDVVLTKQKKEDYKKNLLVRKKTLEQAYLDLPSEILVCINSPDYSENNERKTFAQWCQMLLENEKYRNEYTYFFRCFRDTLKETKNYFNTISIFEKSIYEDIRKEELKKTKNLIRIMQGIILPAKINADTDCSDKRKSKMELIKEFINAVLDLFEYSSEFSLLKKYYQTEYNSDDIAAEDWERDV